MIHGIAQASTVGIGIDTIPIIGNKIVKRFYETRQAPRYLAKCISAVV